MLQALVIDRTVSVKAGDIYQSHPLEWSSICAVFGSESQVRAEKKQEILEMQVTVQDEYCDHQSIQASLRVHIS